MKKLPAFFLSQLLLTFTIHSSPTIIYVTDNDGGNSGSLNTALQNIVDDTIIDCSMIAGQTIFLSSPLPAIGKTPITQTPIVTILGYGVTIDGGSTYPVFSLGQGSATISDFIIQNAGSRGGPGGSAFTGGGGGTGGGGALYVHSGTVMTISAMVLNNNQAIGGAGGDGTTATGTSGGGGGGFGGGRGGSSSATHGAGGGGGGNAGGANGATTGNHAGSNNSFHNYGGAGGGGSGVPPPDNGGSGGTNAANPATTGGMGGVGTGSEGGGGGGGGGCVGSGSGGSEAPNSVGGAGGLGCGPNSDYGVGGAGGGYGDGGGGGASSGASGGGGGYLGNGGGGGILGGGGGAGGETGGAGGFGAGGGGGRAGGNSSYLGGAGGSGSGLPAGGGGGSGLGGAIYIQTSALLIIQDGTSFSGNSTAYGMGGTAASGGTGGGNGSSLGQDIFIQSGGSLNLQINGTLTLLNPICGAGPSASSPGLLTTGTGTVSLNGSNTYLGGTSIQSGTLNLNGSVVGNLTIASAGTLSGNATVIGNITSGGTISPGNSIGTVNTTDLVLTSTSVYDVEINASGSSDLIIASGSAEVAGGVVVIPDNFSTAPVTYTIITTGTGVTGTFSSLTSPVPALMTLIYNPLTVQLTYLSLDPILTGNALRAAKCYGTVPLGSDTAAVNTALIGLSFDEIQTAFEQMGPAQFSGITQVQLLDAILVRSSYTKHMQELWFNKNPCCGRSFVLWSDVAGQWQHQKKSNNCFGYNDTTVGATIGADYCIHKWVLGSAFSYTHDNFNWKQSAGNANINSYYGGFYGRWNDDGFYINAALLGAYNKYRTTRHLDFGTIDRHARSHHHGYEWLINCGAGYQVCSRKFQWTPYINLDYVQLHENSFTEAGAESLDLHVNTKNATLFQGEGGVLLSTAHCACKGVFVPTLKLAYINQTPLSSKNYSANFADSSCTFSGKGRNFERNLFAPRLTLHYQPSGCGVVASIYYGAEIGSRYWAQDVGFTLAIRF